MRPITAKAEMLIRRPVAEVFAAFVDPAITTRFWFTHSSGKLVEGEEVRWEWPIYGAVARVDVKAIEADRRILIEWPTPVEWLFTARTPDTTFVSIVCSGFGGPERAVVSQALDSLAGFTLVLAGAKAWLEHGIELNLVTDHNPDGHIRRSP
jgi:uncharacterized protein YndB with AHSA1/START domain